MIKIILKPNFYHFITLTEYIYLYSQKQNKIMNTQQILSNIGSNGGFDNFNNWNLKEVATWIKSNFDCSNYVANKVAALIK